MATATDPAITALNDRAHAYEQRATKALHQAEDLAQRASEALTDARECQAGAKACRAAVDRLAATPAADARGDAKV